MALKGWETKPGKVRTPDGQGVQMPMKMPVDKGYLNPDTNYSNTEVFNRDKGFSDGKIEGMQSKVSEPLDIPGFDADRQWIVKKGTPYGEAAMFNQLPPGMDIDDQELLDIRSQPLKLCTNGFQYPGDSPWGDMPKDVPE